MRTWRLWLPAILVMAAITVWPIARVVWTSLHSSNLSDPGNTRWIGLSNYANVLGNRTWWLAVAVTLLLVVAAVVVELCLALVFAASLRNVVRRFPVTATLGLLPFLLMPFAVSFFWRDALTNGFGPVWFGYDGSGTAASVAAILAAEIWRGTGIATLILLVGMVRVRPEHLLAARADGATSRQRFSSVVLPTVAPAIEVAVLFRTLDAFRFLEPFWLADRSNPRLNSVGYLLWDNTLTNFEMGLGAAMAVLMLLLAAIIAVILLGLFKVRTLR